MVGARDEDVETFVSFSKPGLVGTNLRIVVFAGGWRSDGDFDDGLDVGISSEVADGFFCRRPGVAAREGGGDTDECVLVPLFDVESAFFDFPNQSLKPRASSPSNIFDSRAFCRSRTISSMVRVSRLTVFNFVRTMGMAASRSFTDK